MEIYVMRHGETVWNAIGKIQGYSKNRLSKLGKNQVEEVANKFKGKKIDYIFSSPLMRTMQTSNIMNKTLQTKIIRDNRIIERNKGILARRMKNTLTDKVKIDREVNPKAYGIETYKEIDERVGDFLQYLTKNFSNKKILIVTHAGIAGNIVKYFLPNSEEISFKNAEIRKIL